MFLKMGQYLKLNWLIRSWHLPKSSAPQLQSPSLAATLGSSQPSSNLNLAAVGLTPGSAGGLEGPDRIFVGGLPYYFTEGQMLGTTPIIPGMFPNILPLAPGQFGELPLIPVQAMTQQATRHARRVYVGGLPTSANEQSVATYFSHVMSAIGGNTAGPGDAVVNVYINHEKKFAFVEMRSVEEASNAMDLDGIMFEGAPVKVRRPSDYNPSLAATLGSSQPSSNLNLAAVGLTQDLSGVLRVRTVYLLVAYHIISQKGMLGSCWSLLDIADIYKASYIDKYSDSTKNVEYDWVVGKVLRCFYDKDFRSDIVELILSLSLFPANFSVKDKVLNWIRIFSGFDKVEVKALEKILEQKQRLQQEM